MSDRKPVIYLKSSGLRLFFDITKNFDIISLTSKRRTQKDKDTKILRHIGTKFGKKLDYYMDIQHNQKHPCFNEITKGEILDLLNKYQFIDTSIDRSVLVSKKQIKGIKDRIVLKLVTEYVKDDRIQKEFDSLPYNEKLIKYTRKKSVMAIQLATPYEESITLHPTKQRRIINLKPSWRNSEIKDQVFCDEDFAYKIRNLFGREYCFVGYFKLKKSQGWVLDNIKS